MVALCGVPLNRTCDLSLLAARGAGGEAMNGDSDEHDNTYLA